MNTATNVVLGTVPAAPKDWKTLAESAVYSARALVHGAKLLHVSATVKGDDIALLAAAVPFLDRALSACDEFAQFMDFSPRLEAHAKRRAVEAALDALYIIDGRVSVAKALNEAMDESTYSKALLDAFFLLKLAAHEIREALLFTCTFINALEAEAA